jgi:hypothetical protein
MEAQTYHGKNTTWLKWLKDHSGNEHQLIVRGRRDGGGPPAWWLVTDHRPHTSIRQRVREMVAVDPTRTPASDSIIKIWKRLAGGSPTRHVVSFASDRCTDGDRAVHDGESFRVDGTTIGIAGVEIRDQLPRRRADSCAAVCDHLRNGIQQDVLGRFQYTRSAHHGSVSIVAMSGSQTLVVTHNGPKPMEEVKEPRCEADCHHPASSLFG